VEPCLPGLLNPCDGLRGIEADLSGGAALHPHRAKKLLLGQSCLEQGFRGNGGVTVWVYGEAYVYNKHTHHYVDVLDSTDALKEKQSRIHNNVTLKNKHSSCHTNSVHTRLPLQEILHKWQCIEIILRCVDIAPYYEDFLDSILGHPGSKLLRM
jgi:hypothetical protein